VNVVSVGWLRQLVLVTEPARRNPQPTGELAQLGERLVCNQEVTGSIPVFSTNLRSRLP
jgi:hypothetical protein